MRSILALAVALALHVPAARAQPPAKPAPALVSPAPPRPAGPPVILVSIDGFRADYLQLGVTPTLARLAREGVVARDGMRPSFPSLTFPNHYTLVTGLYPDHHGIVDNTMDDPAIQPDSHFTIGNFEPVGDGRWWAEGTPIWVRAKAAGLRAATLFWPGSEAAIAGERPGRWAHFDAAITPDTRVDMVLGWLSLPVETRPTFVTLYFDRVDHEGHLFGPGSAQVKAAAAEVDRALARLVAGLKARKLWAGTNLVIVADHGMQAVSMDRVAYIDDWINPAQLTVLTAGPVSGLIARTPAAEAAVLAPHPHVDCRRKGELPTRLHYGANARIPPIVCISEAGWQLTTRARAAARTEAHAGEHGYDPSTPSMAALFLAHGPAFRRGYVQPVFDNIDVAPLLAHLLDLPAAPIDGSLSSLQGALATH